MIETLLLWIWVLHNLLCHLFGVVGSSASSGGTDWIRFKLNGSGLWSFERKLV
jgi:hypothetical protein